MIPPPPATLNLAPMSAMGLVSSALRLIGVIASGEEPTISEANDALMVLNQMADAWNADRLSVFTTRSDDFALVPDKQAYTLGAGGDFNLTRPPQIDSMSVILLTQPDNPVEIPIPMYTWQDWQTKVPVKQVFSSFPQLCYDDGGFPYRTLNFWPIPQQVNNVRIYSWQPLTAGATLQTDLSVPPGYMEAFRYNLAARLSAEFAATLPAAVATIATESLARIKSMNAPEVEMQSDLVPSPAGYNYRADMFGMPY